MTGLELATAVLGKIGVASPADGSPDNDDVVTVLADANRFVKSLNARPLALHAIERATYTWTASQSSRTIGPSGAQLTGTRPLHVLFAKVIPAGAAYEVDVEVLTHGQYAGIGNKAQTADYFHRLLYEPTGATIGTFTVWPVPTTAPTLVIHAKTKLTAIVSATEIDMPGEYEDALVYRLAKRVHGDFGKSWTKENEDDMREAWATVQRANIRVPDERRMPRGFPGAGRGGVSKSDFDAGLV